MDTKNIIIAKFNEDREYSLELVEKERFNTILSSSDFLKLVMTEMVNPDNFAKYHETQVLSFDGGIEGYITKMAYVVKFERGHQASGASDQMIEDQRQARKELYNIIK